MRDFILDNFRWKAGALILAVFVWFTIWFAPWSGITPDPFGTENQAVTHLPIRVLTRPADPAAFQITPKEVDLKVRFKPGRDKNVPPDEFRAFVDLSDMPALGGVSRVKEVIVHAPQGVEIIRTIPKLVLVERVAGSEQVNTNSLIQP